jgi:hypothetical protein
MLVTVEIKCTATRKWEPVANFVYSTLAVECARALSQFDGCTYRVLDNRWPDEANEVTIFYGREIQD